MKIIVEHYIIDLDMVYSISDPESDLIETYFWINFVGNRSIKIYRDFFDISEDQGQISIIENKVKALHSRLTNHWLGNQTSIITLKID